ncbi:hypothetical protein SAMN06265222_103125 [Neorhodopirellula lusitana]|uniref:Secreted protein n=1 Tax=Neorhodopirellula lusitana TaxID=445327 RepID=A0ABY1PXS7_9BACT|nr:hypothetical protein [Neorhodopirellula lusitana]SMP50561.1 hypothetical protein SAMN06265222_103125 [Neorhodopirellula lusitana]
MSKFLLLKFSVALLFVACLVGCEGNKEVEVNLDPSDPLLIESEEVLNYKPDEMSKEDMDVYR